ncbi:MAG: 3-phosphoserine/phosphohydroxythreonine transaminase [bacterium]|nr:3-phosphoserine/phosphohydroxythreonine transaminase [bacterium]
MKNRIINFSAGPSQLPLPVLEQVQADIISYKGCGMSVMEMSHRSAEFSDIFANAKASFKRLLNVPDDYDILFLQGGASLQFSMIPLNLATASSSVDLINTGSWSKKAQKEIKRVCECRVVASSEEDNFLRLPDLTDVAFNRDAAFVHMTSNNTIFGTQWKSFPNTGNVPLVVDMSSDILSRKINVSDFGIIYAGAQKNIGPSGVTVVIIRKDLAERASADLPTMLQYRTHIENDSLYNTPPTFGIYVAGLTAKWIEDQGGLSVIEEKNTIKANVLYDAIENLDMYYCPVEKADRSAMNVVFRIKGNNAELEAQLVKEAAAAGLKELKGHRSVGGLRASIYNAQSLENIKALIQFMETFSKQHA